MTSSTYAMWNKLPKGPVRTIGFSLGMCLRVPYFRTVLPHVLELEPGRCVVTAPKWWGVNNHLKTFHAIAACNIAEIAMGMLAEATVPSTHRWIPKGMAVSYLAPATTGLRGTAQLADVQWSSSGQEVVVPVSITDKSGKEVVHADITIWVTPR
ncbi:hotdog fold domain-containing protein [Actinomycetes bacterium M1A6_2h]